MAINPISVTSKDFEDLSIEIESLRIQYLKEEITEKIIVEDLRRLHIDIMNILKMLLKYKKSTSINERGNIENTVVTMIKLLRKRIKRFRTDKEVKEKIDDEIRMNVGSLTEVEMKLDRLELFFKSLKRGFKVQEFKEDILSKRIPKKGNKVSRTKRLLSRLVFRKKKTD
jgi:hypothetical protein